MRQKYPNQGALAGRSRANWRSNDIVAFPRLSRTVKVRLDGGDQIITASIADEAVEELCLAEGKATTVLVKSTEVTLAVD